MNSSRSVFGAVLGIRRKEEEAGLGAYELVGLRVALGELRRCLGLDKSFDDEPGGGDGVAHGGQWPAPEGDFELPPSFGPGGGHLLDGEVVIR
jgi:hypothetical protein